MSVREESDPERVVAITPTGWARGAGYAHGMAARGRILTIAGQIGWDPRTLEWSARDLVSQTAQALRNVAAVVHAAGGSPSDVVRLTWFLLDRDAYVSAREDIGEAYRSIFGPHYPPMSAVIVTALTEPEALVEIEATAVIPA